MIIHQEPGRDGRTREFPSRTYRKTVKVHLPGTYFHYWEGRDEALVAAIESRLWAGSRLLDHLDEVQVTMTPDGNWFLVTPTT